MIRIAIIAMLSLSVPAAALADARWEKIAVVTGELIGANAGCGIPNDRLVRLGRSFIREINAAVSTERELDLARQTHEGAVATVAAAVKPLREKVCPMAAGALVRAEKACLPPAAAGECLRHIEAQP